MHDLIVADVAQMEPPLTFLDIGCGKGFDTDIPLQRSLVNRADRYIGIEPDTSVTPIPSIQEVHRCTLEDAPLPAESVNVAFAIMVLEHLKDPQPFWDRLLDVLAPGGVFWALTVDARHWVCQASLWLERLRLKELYLTYLLGNRGQERYENYPVYYRCNAPRQIAQYAKRFSSVNCWPLFRQHQCLSLFPPMVRSVLRRVVSTDGKPTSRGANLVVRAVK
jgi:SAM-dependent methyltransferase